jgi:acetylornithine/succinyldiaminopimelate/putrescine aminotransferase
LNLDKLYSFLTLSKTLGGGMLLAAFEILNEENLTNQAIEKGNYLKKQLLKLQEEHGCIGDVSVKDYF